MKIIKHFVFYAIEYLLIINLILGVLQMCKLMSGTSFAAFLIGVAMYSIVNDVNQKLNS